MGFGSGWHWIVVLLVVLLLFGKNKISDFGKDLGKGIKAFKKEMADDEETPKITQTSSKDETQIKNDEEQKA